ncbi:TPA: hypothetical protein DCZ15_01595 [Candidatus Falkowbacteria bacterium]|nr:MAG: hypothetical protein UV95_C0001G0384 [Candidatus Falkowbacteria bacterium GW2011_GWF2_43_32]HBA36550.1 hypothetical protein [Candidatus Falkowbacteria bacterium]
MTDGKALMVEKEPRQKIRRRRRKWRPVFLTVVAILLFFIAKSAFNVVRLSTHGPEVHFFDIGQGDAALIKAPDGQTVLLDGGPDNSVLRRLGDSLPFYRRRLDFVIFSHYHDDHITGLVEVLQRYRVGKLIFAPPERESPILEALWETAAERRVEMLPVENMIRLSFTPDCTLDLLNPNSLGITADDNNSLYARFVCDKQSVLFTGDNSAKAEKALLVSGWPLSAEVLKASHHGSKTANSEEFLRAVNPNLLVISVGEDNRFGHPHPLILERAVDLGISVKRTDELGSLKIFNRSE